MRGTRARLPGLALVALCFAALAAGAQAGRANLEVDPVSGEQLEQVVAELFGLDATVVSRLRELLR